MVSPDALDNLISRMPSIVLLNLWPAAQAIEQYFLFSLAIPVNSSEQNGHANNLLNLFLLVGTSLIIEMRSV